MMHATNERIYLELNYVRITCWADKPTLQLARAPSNTRLSISIELRYRFVHVNIEIIAIYNGVIIQTSLWVGGTA